MWLLGADVVASRESERESEGERERERYEQIANFAIHAPPAFSYYK